MSSEVTKALKQKRKRIVYSCENCRSKKLKCDRNRPVCSTCMKHNLTCEYFDGHKTLTDTAIGLQIQYLKEKLFDLDQKRRDLDKASSSVEVNFTYVLDFASLIKRNKYLNLIRVDSGKVLDTGKVPILIEEQFVKEKRQVSNVEMLRLNMNENNKNSTILLREYLTDKVILWELVNHFFNSELFLLFSFIDRNSFYLKVTEFLQKLETEEKLPKSSIFVGSTLLLILRIAYLSYYNCGYPTYEPSKVIGTEASTLAMLCYDELTGITPNLPDNDLTDLMLLVYYTERFSPEALGPIRSSDRVSPRTIFQKCLDSQLNIDPESNDEEAQLIRRKWQHFLEVERLEFIYSSLPVQINYQNYTTILPIISDTQNDDKIINEIYHERHRIQGVIVEFSKMINNVRNPAVIGDYENFLRKIGDFQIDLKDILLMDSTTKQNRWKKGIKFINFLDIGYIEYVLSMHMFLHYDDTNDDEEAVKRILNHLSRNANQIITLAYFLDSQQQHFYNLRDHFGYTIDLVPRITNALHRGLQFQMTMLTKLCLQSLNNISSPVIDGIKKILYQNSKVIVSSFGRISTRYSYAKRLYMILSFIILQIFSNDVRIEENFASKVLNSGTFTPFGESILNTLLNDLTALTGDRSFDSTYQEPLNDYFGQMLNNRSTDLIQIDTTMIEQLEAFLNSQSFLNT